MSKATVVQYRTRADAGEPNRRLIECVFEELRDRRPAGFLHLVVTDSDEDPLGESAAFRRFQEGMAERLVGPPDFKSMTVVGSYGG
jgi:hypothetical protein